MKTIKSINWIITSLVMLILNSCYSDVKKQPIAFNSNVWLTGDWKVRGNMVDSIINDSILIGQSKTDVLKLLGSPTASDTTNPFVYVVDTGLKTGPFGLGGTWLFYLTVQYDTLTGKVKDVWCRD
jgi:outer membrane protein assembly factor BamE (lipoprotein component of BamABCDE complex)